MKLLYILLLFPLFGHAQIKNSSYKIKLIDSIADANRAGIQTSGFIKKNKLLFWKKTIGSFSEDIYMDSVINPENAKKLYLIKASYQKKLSITKNIVEYIYSDFYYDKTLFFVYLKKITENQETGTITYSYEIDLSKEINSEIDKELGFDVKNWITSQDNHFKEVTASLYRLNICTY